MNKQFGVERQSDRHSSFLFHSSIAVHSQVLYRNHLQGGLCSLSLSLSLAAGKNQRLKEAKEEAQKEIEEYRRQRQKTFEEQQSKVDRKSDSSAFNSFPPSSSSPSLSLSERWFQG